jgi:hypothetical protein
MSSSVCRGIDTTTAAFDHDSSGVRNGQAFQSDSIRRELVSRCFLRWYDAAIAEKRNDGEGANEEKEVEKNVLQDMFVMSFGDPGHITHFSMSPRTAMSFCGIDCKLLLPCHVVIGDHGKEASEGSDGVLLGQKLD